jgi:hypothetical protein
MKKLAILSAAFVLVALIGVSASAMRMAEDNALLATWDVTISAPGMELPGTFKLEKDGENFKGAVNTEMGEVPLKNIKIKDDNSFTADITANVQGQTMEGTMNGKVTDGKISGEINLAGLGSIPYSGKKAEKK